MNQLPVSIKTYKIAGPNLHVYYPVIVDLPNPEAERKMNAAIINEVKRLIHQQTCLSNRPTEMTGYYEIKTNERGILSLSLFNYAYSGGPHGITLQKSLTFNVETGNLYTLKDVFLYDLNYIESVSSLIQHQMIDRSIPLSHEFKQIRPDQDFYIADKALVVYFQENEITPYEYGFQYFPISVYQIQDIILEQPLGKMLN